MSDALSDERQMMIVDTHTHYATLAGQVAISNEVAKEELLLVSTLKLTPFLDGDQYCFLYGENIMEGVSGFGDTVQSAMFDFNRNFAGTTAPQAA